LAQPVQLSPEKTPRTALRISATESLLLDYRKLTSRDMTTVLLMIFNPVASADNNHRYEQDPRIVTRDYNVRADVQSSPEKTPGRPVLGVWAAGLPEGHK
jgi:hypothetical protein